MKKGVSLGLEGKTVVVTGGSRGIGAAVVCALLECGARVASVSLHGGGDPRALKIKADVTDEKAVRRAFACIERSLGPVYGVVANAGVTRDATFANMTPDRWKEVLDVNLNGVFNTVRPVFDGMCARGAGSIVVVSSVMGERGNFGQTNYAASKAAVIGFAKSLAREGARKGVRVNALAPGLVRTRMVEAIPGPVKSKLAAEIPLGRFGEPEEAAWAAVFLLSPRLAGYVTGEVLRVNGGFYT